MNNMDLIKEAKKVRENAYAPYSRFKVGAAILTGTGKVFAGVNVENASYGLTICAERAAIFAAVAAGETEVVSVAIATDGPEPTLPCGACRQVLSEFGESMQVIASTVDGEVQQFDLKELLPNANQGITKKHV
jgi:cytidine deaminase